MYPTGWFDQEPHRASIPKVSKDAPLTRSPKALVPEKVVGGYAI